MPSEAGRYLFAHSDPADRIFVWGQSPDIYLDAHRRPACRYITTFPLTGYVFGGPIPGFDTRSRILPGAWTTLEQDFARHPPTYIVDVQPDPKSAYYPVKNFPILAKLLKERYQPVSTLLKVLFIGCAMANRQNQRVANKRCKAMANWASDEVAAILEKPKAGSLFPVQC